MSTLCEIALQTYHASMYHHTRPALELLIVALVAFRRLPECVVFFRCAQTVDGVVLTDGSRLPYKMSGHAAFWTSLVAM